MLKRIFLLIICLFTLTACATFPSGVISKPNLSKTTNSIKLLRDDIKIRFKLYKQISSNEAFKHSNIDVSSYNRMVILTGQTNSDKLRNKATRIAQSHALVQRVYNEIRVSGLSSSLTRISDSWITTKVKTELLTAKQLPSRKIKVLTENGTVYLIGRLSHAQARKAVTIARHTTGAQRVVTLFEYSKPLTNHA